MRFSLPSLLANWPLKLAALGLALLLWVVVSADQVTTQWISVRVEPVVRDPDVVLIGGPDPADVRVRFTGAGRELVELALQRPVLVLPVDNVGERRTFTVDPQMVRRPPGLNVVPHEVRPATVRLELAPLATRQVPVSPRIGDASRERYVIHPDVEVTPPTVRVSGPEAVVAALDSIPTRVFEIVPDDTLFLREVPLDTAGLGELSFARDRVVVAGRVDRIIERTVAGIAVSTPAGVIPVRRQVEVSLRGPERVVRAVFPATLRVVVPRDSVPAELPPGGVEVGTVVEGLPAGVTARAPRLTVAPAPDADPAEPDATPAVPGQPPGADPPQDP